MNLLSNSCQQTGKKSENGKKRFFRLLTFYPFADKKFDSKFILKSTAVDSDRTCANSGGGLKMSSIARCSNIADGVRIPSTAHVSGHLQCDYGI